MNECQEHQAPNISLMDLIFYCLEKWRWIVACMLVMAIIAGVFKYQSTIKENKQLGQRTDISVEGIETDEPYQSGEFYEHAIEQMGYDLKIQKDYLNQSVVMQLDPYHIVTGTISYYVEGGEQTGSVIAAYSTFISSGRLAEEMYAIDADIPVEDLRYLISFNNSTNETYKIEDKLVSPVLSDGSVFQIQIRMPDNELVENYLKRVKEIMVEYASQLQTEVAEHKLTELACVQSEMADADMQEYQSTMRSAYATSVRNLQTLQTEFKTLQGAQDVHDAIASPENPVSSSIKFGVLGLLLGAFLSCIVLLLLYLLGGKLQDIGEFKEEFGMPLLGIVRISGNKRKIFSVIDSWVFHLRGGIYAKVTFEEQIKIAAANVRTAITNNFHDKGTKRIMLSGTMSKKDADALCLRLASEIPEASLSSYNQILFQSSALKELENYDGILFLEKRGTSDSSFIMQEKKIALDRDVRVLGTVVVC